MLIAEDLCQDHYQFPAIAQWLLTCTWKAEVPGSIPVTSNIQK